MTARHRSAVPIPQGHACGGGLVGARRQVRGRREELHPNVLGRRVHHGRRLGVGWHIPRTSGEALATRAHCAVQAVHIRTGGPQAGDDVECIILLARHDPAGRARRDGLGVRRDAVGERIEALERAIEAVEVAIELHAHLDRERPAGVVVRTRRRGTRIGKVVRVILRFKHVEHVRTEGLVALHDVRAGTILLAADAEGRRGTVHNHTSLLHRDQELLRGEEVGLIHRNHVPTRHAQVLATEVLFVGFLRRAAATPEVGIGHGIRHWGAPTTAAASATADLGFGVGEDLRRDNPIVLATALDHVVAHAPDIEQHGLTVARGVVEDRLVGGHRVVDRLLEMPFLERLEHIRLVGEAQHARRDERNGHRRRIADGLRQNADHVVEVGHGAKAAVPPGRVRRQRAVDDTRLVLHFHARVDRGADHVDASDDRLVEVVVGRITERRGEHHRASGAGLVVVVHDLREPGQVHPLVHVGGFVLVRDVEVAIVVVPDVLLVEARDVHVALLRVGFLHVPVGHKLHAVRIRMHEHDHDVVQDAQRLLIGAGEHLVVGLDQLIGAEDFGRMQSAVNPDHRLSFLGERLGLSFADFGVGELLGDLAEPGELLDVLRARHDHRQLRASFSGHPHRVEFRARRFLGNLLPIAHELGVVRQPVIVADVVPKVFLRRGNLALSRNAGWGREERGDCQGDGRDAGEPASNGGGTHAKLRGTRAVGVRGGPRTGMK